MDDLHISLKAEELFKIGPIPVTNSMLTMFLVMILVLVVFTFVARRATAVPTRGQSVIELIIEFIWGLVRGSAGEKQGRQLMPLISGVFIFILFANFSGLLPGMGTIGKMSEEETHVEEEGHLESATPEAGEVVTDESDADHEDETAVAATDDHADDDEHHGPTLVPFLRAPTADLNMTLALALLTFTVVQVAGISAHGVVGRIKHMADPPFLFPIELISEFSRIISLSARLFGNVFAGEVLLGVMYTMGAAIKIALVPFLFPVVFLGLEVMFGTIQALVFGLLTLIYITLATAHSHGDEHEEEHGHAEDGATPGHAAAAASGD